MTHSRHFSIPDLLPYISWGYFFHAWALSPRMASLASLHDCPACRAGWLQQFGETERAQAETAMSLWQDAKVLLRQWADEGRHAICRVRIERAWSEDDDIVLPDAGMRLPMLRQQTGSVCLCLSDFIAPKGYSITDSIALFASTTEPEMEQSFAADAYRHMLAQTLADRLAEAAAEVGHLLTRREWWGYAPDEQLPVAELLSARYQGIRPAVGYPSLPDQSLNFLLSDLLDFPSLGITLTEHGAMLPHASTSGLMLAHEKACYFSVGKVGEDQLQDYAKRRGLSADFLRQFLH